MSKTVYLNIKRTGEHVVSVKVSSETDYDVKIDIKGEHKDLILHLRKTAGMNLKKLLGFGLANECLAHVLITSERDEIIFSRIMKSGKLLVTDIAELFVLDDELYKINPDRFVEL